MSTRSNPRFGRVFRPALGIATDLNAFALAAAKLAAPKTKREWTAELRSIREASRAVSNQPGGLNVGAVMRELETLLTPDAICTCDAGNFAGWPQRYLNFAEGQRFFGPTNGAMGYSVPAAVGLKIAYPDRMVVSFVGDGGFMMTGQEIATAFHHGVAPIVLVFNNSMYGTIRMYQERSYPGRVSGTALTNPDFCQADRSLWRPWRDRQRNRSIRPRLPPRRGKRQTRRHRTGDGPGTDHQPHHHHRPARRQGRGESRRQAQAGCGRAARQEEDRPQTVGALLMEYVLAAILVVIIIGIGMGVRTVPQGQVWTVERFGRFTRLLQPGLNLMTPMVERIGHKMNVQEIVLDIPEQAVITRDNAAVMVDGIMYYRVLDAERAAYGAYNLVQALSAMAMTNIRSVIGALDLDGALSSRDEINGRLARHLGSRHRALGRQGQPGGTAQDRAAGQPGDGDEPADDRRTRTPRRRRPRQWRPRSRRRPRRGRQAGAGAGGRRPPRRRLERRRRPRRPWPKRKPRRPWSWRRPPKGREAKRCAISSP